MLERRDATRDERQKLEVLEEALRGFHELRAGSAGCLTVRPVSTDATTGSGSLFAPSRTWLSVTPYHVNRHARQAAAHEALAMDLRTECRRRGLLEPRVTATDCRGEPGIGLVGRAKLGFAVAVAGPILLGRGRHTGSGLFAGSA